MTILIANIGTSDLAVNVEGYYLPIRFDRNEPNLDESQLTEDEKTIWDREYRQYDVINKLCPELGVETKPDAREKFAFREFTEKLLTAYEQDEEKWHSRISPGRLQGVVTTAKEQFQARSAFIFVTDQPQKHKDDSIYLFKILKKWFWREMEFDLIPKYIPSDTNDFAVNLDRLLDFYYRFFHKLELNPHEEILVSIKGGTPQMQNALRLQSISSTIPKQLFIEPKLSVKNILAGQPSECELTAYWKYMRNQKYQTVQQLLDRWDFDGASKILRDWQQVLQFLIDQKVLNQKEIQQSRDLVHLVIHGLETARSLFNLDVEGARDLLEKNSKLKEHHQFGLSEYVNPKNYDSLLNLYTQCCIYKDLLQIANFLARVGSFYESAISRLIEKAGGNHYLNNWKVNIKQLQGKIGQDLLQEFTQLEGRSNLENFYNIKFSRYSKRNYLDILIKYRAQTNSQGDLDNWINHQFQLSSGETFNGISGLLKALDYWIEKRNDLVHNAEGLSEVRINDFNHERPQEACTYDDIIPILTQILKNPLLALNRIYRQEFVEQPNYYIYSNAKDSAVALLMADASDN